MKFVKIIKIQKGDRRITCYKCGWSWAKSVGGSNPYLCHECNTDNSKKYN
jgi:hypothetical protein